MASLVGLLGLFGCASPSAVEKKFGPLQTVQRVELNRFMGDWYVIANIPTFVEQGAHNAIERYTWNDKAQRIDVLFRFRKDRFDGPCKEMTQKGFVVNHTTNAQWRVQPFWPLKLPYLIIDLAEDYSYTVIGVPDRAHVWIMARTPTMAPALLERLTARLAAVGYDIDKLQRVPQQATR